MIKSIHLGISSSILWSHIGKNRLPWIGHGQVMDVTVETCWITHQGCPVWGQDWVPQSDGECHLELNTWIIDLYTLYKNIHGTI
jgi:hypothetical protein